MSRQNIQADAVIDSTHPGPSGGDLATSSRSSRHKGRGSHGRRQEGFRYRKNVETVRNVRDELRAKFSLNKDSPFNTLSSCAHVAINSRVTAAVVEKPVRTISIITSGVRELFDPTIQTLRNMKITVTDEEYRAFIYVTARQISAKIYFCQIGYGAYNDWQLANHNEYTLTAAALSECLKPIAIYIQSMGSFTLHGQTNIPVVAVDYDQHAYQVCYQQHLFESYEFARRDEVRSHILRNQLTADPIHGDPLLGIQPDGTLLQIEPHVMFTHYKTLISKVIRRNADAVVNLDLRKGAGSHVQLVGSYAEQLDLRCGCVYPIDHGDLAMGALFGFGRYDITNGPVDPLHNIDVATQVVRVVEPGWAQEYSMCMYKTGT